jgi:hypothetical protein
MRKALLISTASFLFFAGCGPQGAAPQGEVGGSTEGRRYEPSASRSENERPSLGTRIPVGNERRGSDVGEAKVRFLNQIRSADPQFRTIERAVMNEQNELGLVLTRNVEMDDIPKLMQSLLKQMAGQFPGEDLTIVAYAPSNPPMKIGTGRLDARTREMTYTAAQR